MNTILLMDNYHKLYWFTRLDNINQFICGVCIIAALICIIIPISCAIHADFDEFNSDIENRKLTRTVWLKKLNWIVPVTILIFVLKVFVPTQKDIIIIMAGGKTMDYVQSDSNLSKIPYKTTNLIVEYLDKQLKDVKK